MDSTKMDKLDAALRFGSEALNLRARRQELLAANIANADTPGYKARDIDFRHTLEQVVAQQGRHGGGLGLATTSARHLGGNARALPDTALLYRVPVQSSIDGNTVDMNVERVDFADNAVRYEAGLTTLGARIKTLLSAVQQ